MNITLFLAFFGLTSTSYAGYFSFSLLLSEEGSRIDPFFFRILFPPPALPLFTGFSFFSSWIPNFSLTYALIVTLSLLPNILCELSSESDSSLLFLGGPYLTISIDFLFFITEPSILLRLNISNLDFLTGFFFYSYSSGCWKEDRFRQLFRPPLGFIGSLLTTLIAVNYFSWDANILFLN